MYIKRGDSFIPTNKDNTDIRDQLPVGNYTVKVDDYGNLFFEQLSSFPIPKKVYGDTIKTACKILYTFKDRDSSTGILLTGEKGSGKTMLAKIISHMIGEQLQAPTIIINSPWTGDKFNQLIQELPVAVIIFDEFEKVYNDPNDQKLVLTLLDGVFPSKKLFIFTSNDKYSIDAHMHNRPGRIFYTIDYKGLTPDFIEEYCMDNLVNKTRIQDIIKASSMFDAFNFDMLQALVQEMNRYNETPYESLKLLNIRPGSNEGSYEVNLTHRGVKISAPVLDTEYIRGNPLSHETISIFGYFNFKVENSISVPTAVDTELPTKYPSSTASVIDDICRDLPFISISFNRDSLTKTEIEKGIYTYVNGDTTLVLTKRTIGESDCYKWMNHF